MKRLLLIFLIFSSSFVSAQTGKPVPASAEPVVKILKFYPNPAITVINFEFQDASQKGYTLQIYNFIGKKVSEFTSLTSKTSIDLSEFFRGVYIYQLRDKTGRIVESGKFQVVK